MFLKSLFATLLIILGNADAQIDNLHGDFMETRNGTHAGNQFRTTFYNDGLIGGNQVPPDIYGEWPINSGHLYLHDGNIFVGAEVHDRNGDLKHIISTNPRNTTDDSPSAGDVGPNGEKWSFLPLPGFARPDQMLIAMSKYPEAWPASWPDKMDDPVDPGWPDAWNGYFGKNIFNADEESYYVADDYNNREFLFYPDSIDSLRRGLGIRVYARGFQWSNALVEDALFVLYDFENVSTYNHDKLVFGYKFGNNMGESTTAGDGDDDNGAYDKEEDVAYLWDNDDIGGGGWTPVGYFGGAFLESPGNPYDGIDNDGDGAFGSGLIIDEAMFAPRELRAGDEIVLVDYTTFERTVLQMPDDTLRIQYQDQQYLYWPGKFIEEKANNLVDDNLNGIIDENNGATFGTPPNEITTYLYLGSKCINFITGEGSDNHLLDEQRDDGIDNDEDWNMVFDDLGQDGAPFTKDPGEGNGVPTAGEPHFDKTDIDETDMIGLTSFTLYFWPDIPRSNDQLVWEAITPGYLDDLLQNTNTELLYGSGYFPLKPGNIERFSIGIILGDNRDDFYENKKWVAKAYNENYNFAKSPNIPTVTAIAGDKKVTLMWDDLAEKSVDPITGEDFEGYRIYRSTDPGWRDMIPVTDGFGSVTYRKPLVQFDIDNDFSGFAPVAIKGIQFWLGDNMGLTHTFIDTTVKNGFTYYYAVTSFDHGDPDNRIPPSECTRFIAVNQDGTVDKGSNIAIVRPEAPVAGHIPAGLDTMKLIIRPEGLGTTTGKIGISVLNPDMMRDGHKYQVTFEDTALSMSISGITQLTRMTRNFTLTDLSSGEVLLDRSTQIGSSENQPVSDGFQLKFYGDSIMIVNTEQSGWNREDIQAFSLTPFRSTREPTFLEAADYLIEFGEIGYGTSETFLRQGREVPSVPVNFKVYKLYPSDEGEIRVESKFGFRENDGEDGMFSGFIERATTVDEIVILGDDLVAGYQVSFDRSAYDSLKTIPGPGDWLRIQLNKPFLSHDVFQFTLKKAAVDEEAAKHTLVDIRVVPNPYIVANSWEPHNLFSNGRGPRELHFINLPARCTISIFNVQGQLVNRLEYDSANLADGTYIWDMQTKDKLDIAYGIYLYYIDAGKVGSHAGKFAVIK
jgi:hypothetical protein